jgi:transcriptional regulator NrdR family protein
VQTAGKQKGTQSRLVQSRVHSGKTNKRARRVSVFQSRCVRGVGLFAKVGRRVGVFAKSGAESACSQSRLVRKVGRAVGKQKVAQCE